MSSMQRNMDDNALKHAIMTCNNISRQNQNFPKHCATFLSNPADSSSKPIWMNDSPSDVSFGDSSFVISSQKACASVGKHVNSNIHQLRSVTAHQSHQVEHQIDMEQSNVSKWDRYHNNQSPNETHQQSTELLAHMQTGIYHLKPMKNDTKTEVELTSDVSDSNFSQDSFFDKFDETFDQYQPKTTKENVDNPKCIEYVGKSAYGEHFDEDEDPLGDFNHYPPAKLLKTDKGSQSFTKQYIDDHSVLSNSISQLSHRPQMMTDSSSSSHAVTPLVNAGTQGRRQGFKAPRAVTMCSVNNQSLSKCGMIKVSVFYTCNLITLNFPL